jgi:serine protease Do
VESLVEPALRSGLREGDVILAVGNIEVSQVKDFTLAVGKLDKSKPISVLFRRGELTRYTLIRPNS